jgi:hypothetical protein
MDVPEGLLRRELRLDEIVTAKAKIEQPAAVAFKKNKKSSKGKWHLLKQRRSPGGALPRCPNLEPKARTKSTSPRVTLETSPRLQVT